MHPAHPAFSSTPAPRRPAAALSLALGVGAALAFPSLAGAFNVLVDPAPVSFLFDDFNDGVDTAAGFFNTSSAGEAGGFTSISVPAGASDPQFQFSTPGGSFDPVATPHLRLSTRGTVGGGGQVFPLPPSAATMLDYGNPVGAFGEVQMDFVIAGPGVSGSGLRIDPIGGGTAQAETFDFDYIYLDRVATIGLAEFDHDGALDGWGANPHITGSSSAATSTFVGTTGGNDPTLTRGGLSIDTSIYDTIEVSVALDPASTSRFEIFWGTSTFPGPAGGQSVVITDLMVRDGDLHTYRIDMSDEARWDGNLNVLRIDPLADADSAAGRAFEIGHIRVLNGAAIPEPATLALLAGLAAVAGAALRRRR